MAPAFNKGKAIDDRGGISASVPAVGTAPSPFSLIKIAGDILIKDCRPMTSNLKKTCIF